MPSEGPLKVYVLLGCVYLDHGIDLMWGFLLVSLGQIEALSSRQAENTLGATRTVSRVWCLRGVGLRWIGGGCRGLACLGGAATT